MAKKPSQKTGYEKVPRDKMSVMAAFALASPKVPEFVKEKAKAALRDMGLALESKDDATAPPETEDSAP